VSVDYRSDVPPYRQVAAIIVARIESGELAPGDPVPSVARMMQDYGIARTTAGKVLGYLRDEGWITIVRGWGSFVARDLPAR
jgi:DNA-binding GntR family transcriptional regulator